MRVGSTVERAGGASRPSFVPIRGYAGCLSVKPGRTAVDRRAFARCQGSARNALAFSAKDTQKLHTKQKKMGREIPPDSEEQEDEAALANAVEDASLEVIRRLRRCVVGRADGAAELSFQFAE